MKLANDVRGLISWFRSLPRPPEVDALIERVMNRLWWLERLEQVFKEDER